MPHQLHKYPHKSASYSFPQITGVDFILLLIEDTQEKQSQQQPGSLKESGTGTQQPCDPDVTICIAGPDRPVQKRRQISRKDKSSLTLMFFESAMMIRLSKEDTNKQQKMVMMMENKLRRLRSPIAISGDNVYIVWFNDLNTPNNNSEVLFRSLNDSGVTFTDKST